MASSKPPKRFLDFLDQYKEVGDAYKSLGKATLNAGPLDAKTAALVKLGIAVGMRHEGAVHAHTRKAQNAGASPQEIRHAVLLSTTTLGFPNMMAGLSWADDVLKKED
jgi:alkylhydroperoxidase/carboxymuconolactone decarboxylase family protein YurZ